MQHFIEALNKLKLKNLKLMPFENDYEPNQMAVNRSTLRMVYSPRGKTQFGSGCVVDPLYEQFAADEFLTINSAGGSAVFRLLQTGAVIGVFADGRVYLAYLDFADGLTLLDLCRRVVFLLVVLAPQCRRILEQQSSGRKFCWWLGPVLG